MEMLSEIFVNSLTTLPTGFLEMVIILLLVLVIGMFVTLRKSAKVIATEKELLLEESKQILSARRDMNVELSEAVRKLQHLNHINTQKLDQAEKS